MNLLAVIKHKEAAVRHPNKLLSSKGTFSSTDSEQARHVDMQSRARYVSLVTGLHCTPSQTKKPPRRSPRPLSRIDRWEGFNRDITVGKGHTRESIGIWILAQCRGFVHGFAIGIYRIPHVHNAGAAQLFALAICPSCDTLIDVDAVVDE